MQLLVTGAAVPQAGWGCSPDSGTGLSSNSLAASLRPLQASAPRPHRGVSQCLPPPASELSLRGPASPSTCCSVGANGPTL